MNIEDLVRPNIRKLKPFSSARAEFNGEAEVFLDANENPFESSFNRYPDPYHNALRTAISKWRNVDKESILLGNGSDELIDMVIRTFCRPRKDIVRCIQPTFGMYQVSCSINDVVIQNVRLTEDFELDHEWCVRNQVKRNKILILCSPNNPTGNNLDLKRILYVLDNWEGIVVVDEAYIDFSKQASLINKLKEYPNLIVLQTFSKAIGAAGLRIGMCFASPEIVKYISKVKPPYNIGTVTQKAALDLLSDQDRILKEVNEIKEQRDWLLEELYSISGLEKIFPTDSNFVLVRCKNHNALKQSLQQEGVVIRDRSSLQGCERCLRMTIGKKKENVKLLKGIRLFYKS